MILKTNIKAGNRTGVADNGGRTTWNHNETSIQRTRSLKVKSGVKAGPIEVREIPIRNHNETQAQSRGFIVKTGIKAGPSALCPNCKIKRSEFP